MFRRSIHILLAASALASPGAAIAAAPSCIGDVCLVDRGATGEINFGYQRGGFAVLDFDGDGFQDLVFANAAGVSSRLFRNVPDLARPGRRSFSDVTAGSGLDDADGTARSAAGVLAADYDDDGDPDVYMTGALPNGTSFGLLYRNDGAGHFSNVSVASGVRSSGMNPQSASFVDFDLDGDLDLLVAGPEITAPVRLFRNEGGGLFQEAPQLLPSLGSTSTLYAHVWTDYDGDGDPDCFLLTTGPLGPIVLRNDVDAQGNRSFQNAAQSAGFTSLGPAPMGIAAGDYDGDGDLDLAITDAARGTYYRNDAGRMTLLPLVSSIFGWGVTWLDVDNDGDLDLYQAGSWSRANFDKLFRNLGGGSFDDVSPALNGTNSASQYAASVDVDNDGRIDIVTINPGSPGLFVSVYENATPSTAPWLRLSLDGRASTARDAVGAIVRLHAGGRTQVRELQNGSSTTSTEDQRLHFGLGTATQIDSIEIVWPRAGSLSQRTELYPGPFPLRTEIALSPHDPAQPCNDGLDNDADGRVDYPADAECLFPSDASELAECADGIDNDGDERVDFPADPECASLAGAHEGVVLPACGLLGLEAVLPITALCFGQRMRRRRAQRGSAS